PFSYVVSVSLSNGDGTLATPLTINTGTEPSDLVAGDLNNDGNPDLLSVGRHGSIVVLLGNGSGGFNLTFGPNTGANFSRVALADLNGDSKLDLVITDYFGLRVI